jgi:hypothetical protein
VQPIPMIATRSLIPLLAMSFLLGGQRLGRAFQK